MPVENRKATAVANADATPPIKSPAFIAGGVLREIVATVEVAAADDDTSVFRFARVHSGWRISEIQFLNDAITGGTVFDIGLYQTAENGGTAVDADCYGTDITFATARGATGAVELGFEQLDIANIEQRVWQNAGLAADPGRYYDLCLTGDTVGTAAGTISARIRYVEN